jgi:hydroxyethylthiazole kinase
MPVKASKFAVDAADQAAAILAKIRAEAPRIHSITNSVGQGFTANMLLAAGAVPSMTTSAEEIGDFVASARAILINLGTLDDERRHAIGLTVVAARASKIPWVLDPVFVDRSPSRLALARTLLQRGPAVVRLNRLEFSALAGGGEDQVRRVAQQNATVVALTGVTDTIADARRTAQIENGHVLMSKVTAMGCAGSALVAAALAVESDPFVAATGALTCLGIAGELAAKRCKGPGGFASAILDVVYEMTDDDIHARARVVT